MPGAGLLLLRVAAGIALVAHGFTRLQIEPSTGPVIGVVLAGAGGTLLVAGLWTPVAGSLAAMFGLWNTISQRGDLWTNILLGSIGAALALLGPGAWSIDAKLFGWKRIDFHERDSRF